MPELVRGIDICPLGYTLFNFAQVSIKNSPEQLIRRRCCSDVCPLYYLRLVLLAGTR